MRIAAALLLLLVVTAAVYAGVGDHDFIIVDDGTYVFLNPWVLEGLTGPGVTWAFTTFEAFNWHPLTWLSHMADVSLVGPEPEPQHLVSVGFHLLNTVLLFAALRSLTGAGWESFFVAALFALHPMHVESVAWISERKDVLSACFWFLALWAYSGYAARPGILRYALVALAMAGGLLAKPMVVTLPMVLLLLDAWPLRRVAWPDLARWAWLFVEKLPLLLLSAGASVITMIAQQPGVELTAETLPWTARLGNAIVAYASYLRLTAWPDALSAFYPHPGWVPIGTVLAAAAMLLAITALAVWTRDRRPYLLVGWLWFLGTLVPVIGLVQVGDQAMADRYTYVPHVGLFLMVTFAAADLIRAHASFRIPVVAAAVVALVALAATTRAQVARWENTETLFTYSLSITEANAFSHFNIATVLLFEERRDEAREHLRAAVEADPDYPEALNGLGNLALQDGNETEALALYERAAEAASYLFEPHFNAATLLQSRGELDAALPYYRKAVALEPYHPGVHYHLATLFEERRSFRKAATHYRRALQLAPDFTEARQGLRRVRPHLPKRPAHQKRQSPSSSAPSSSAPSGSM